jgi:hypothetical protein
MLRVLLALTLVATAQTNVLAQGAAGFDFVEGTPASAINATNGTAAAGAPGSVNDATSDVTMTENNDQKWFDVRNTEQNPNTHTSKTLPMQWRNMTAKVLGGNAQTGLLAPSSVDQFYDHRSFAFVWTCGFPAPKGVTGPGSPDPMGQNWSPGGNIYLPDTGTPSVSADVTLGGGY